MSLGRMGTLQEHIVVRIGTFPKTFGGPDPERLLADGEKSLLNHVVTAPKPGTANHFFVSREPATLMAEYARITGYPELPPLWSFGYQQSHRTLASREEILGEAR